MYVCVYVCVYVCRCVCVCVRCVCVYVCMCMCVTEHDTASFLAPVRSSVNGKAVKKEATSQHKAQDYTSNTARKKTQKKRQLRTSAKPTTPASGSPSASATPPGSRSIGQRRANKKTRRRTSAMPTTPSPAVAPTVAPADSASPPDMHMCDCGFLHADVTAVTASHNAHAITCAKYSDASPSCLTATFQPTANVKLKRRQGNNATHLEVVSFAWVTRYLNQTLSGSAGG